jgi:hypothetical protein
VPVWVALWGATGALTHAYAVFARGLLERSPMLQHLSPASAIIFATFAFGFYGFLLLLVAWRVERLLHRGGTVTGGHGPVL